MSESDAAKKHLSLDVGVGMQTQLMEVGPSLAMMAQRNLHVQGQFATDCQLLEALSGGGGCRPLHILLAGFHWTSVGAWLVESSPFLTF